MCMLLEHPTARTSTTYCGDQRAQFAAKQILARRRESHGPHQCASVCANSCYATGSYTHEATKRFIASATAGQSRPTAGSEWLARAESVQQASCRCSKQRISSQHRASDAGRGTASKSSKPRSESVYAAAADDSRWRWWQWSWRRATGDAVPRAARRSDAVPERGSSGEHDRGGIATCYGFGTLS